MSVNSHLLYAGSSVLVTGASGFIGTHLCKQLNYLGAHVNATYCSSVPGADHSNWMQLDLRDPEATRQLVKETRPDYIFHLASSVDGRREPDAVLSTFENNLSGTVNLLLAAQDWGGCRRVVLANSQEEPDGDVNQAVPCSPYAASKSAASSYARMFHSLYGLPCVIARVFMVYGPGQLDQRKLVPYCILRALDGKAPELTSGRRKVDWVYVDDVINGLLKLGSEPGVEGDTIELGSGEYHTVKALVEEILRQIDPAIKGCFGGKPDRAMERERLARVGATAEKIDWQAEVALEEGIRRTVAWYREKQQVLSKV